MAKVPYDPAKDDILFEGLTEPEIRALNNQIIKTFPKIRSATTHQAYSQKLMHFCKVHHLSCEEPMKCGICCFLKKRYPEPFLIEKQLQNLFPERKKMPSYMIVEEK
jgi:hypothetical protein